MATTKKDPNVFLLPDLGEGVHEAELVSWKVQEGDTVEELQVLAEMETDKALAEVPAPRAGTIKTLHFKEGDTVEVGQPLVSFVSDDGDEPAQDPVQTQPAKDASPPRKQADDQEREDAGSVVGSLSAMPAATEGKALATPAVRRLARDLGIDINQVPGSGISGRVMEKDVRQFAEAGGSGERTSKQAPARPAHRQETNGEPAQGGATAASFVPAAMQFAPVQVDSAGVAERIPFRGVRRKIAESLSRSVHTAVHFTCVDEADVTALDKLRAQLAGMTGRKISFLPFLMQAVCYGLKQHPTINANVDDEKGEILIKGVINLGCAVDTDHGLMVPVITNADRLTILQLGDKVAEVAAACKNRTIDRENLTGGTFTISNVGSYGGMFATPIINYPEVGIIAVGRARRKVMAREDGSFYAGLAMPLSVSCDHRVVDGAEAARFLNTVVRVLEQPEQLARPAGR